MVATVSVGTRPGPIAITPDGAFAYVGRFVSPGVGGVDVIDIATNTVITTVIVGNQPFGIAITPNGAFAYVANFVGSSVSVIDTATNTVVATIIDAVGARTPSAVDITGDGAFAYVTNANSNSVSVIDTATNTITTLISGFSVPGGVAITKPRNNPPVARCQNVTVPAGPTCTANASIDNGSSDPDSGDTITLSQSPAGPYPLGTTTVTLTVTDSHGASSQCTSTVTVVDTTPPTIMCPGNIVSPGNPDVNPGTPTATDNCSGVMVVGVRSDAQPLNAPYPFGTTIIIWTATDGAGNQATCTQTVTVTFNFTGFFSPVNNLPTVNMVNAGRAIPIKFSLGGNQGLNIFAPGYPVSQQIACNDSAPVGVIEETATAGNSSLSYDPVSDQYTYGWKTNKAWEGTCRQLIVKLRDGSEHVAVFKFK